MSRSALLQVVQDTALLAFDNTENTHRLGFSLTISTDDSSTRQDAASVMEARKKQEKLYAAAPHQFEAESGLKNRRLTSGQVMVHLTKDSVEFIDIATALSFATVEYCALESVQFISGSLTLVANHNKSTQHSKSAHANSVSSSYILQCGSNHRKGALIATLIELKAGLGDDGEDDQEEFGPAEPLGFQHQQHASPSRLHPVTADTYHVGGNKRSLGNPRATTVTLDTSRNSSSAVGGAASSFSHGRSNDGSTAASVSTHVDYAAAIDILDNIVRVNSVPVSCAGSAQSPIPSSSESQLYLAKSSDYQAELNPHSYNKGNDHSGSGAAVVAAQGKAAATPVGLLDPAPMYETYPDLKNRHVQKRHPNHPLDEFLDMTSPRRQAWMMGLTPLTAAEKKQKAQWKQQQANSTVAGDSLDATPTNTTGVDLGATFSGSKLNQTISGLGATTIFSEGLGSTLAGTLSGTQRAKPVAPSVSALDVKDFKPSELSTFSPQQQTLLDFDSLLTPTLGAVPASNDSITAGRQRRVHYFRTSHPDKLLNPEFEKQIEKQIEEEQRAEKAAAEKNAPAAAVTLGKAVTETASATSGTTNEESSGRVTASALDRAKERIAARRSGVTIIEDPVGETVLPKASTEVFEPEVKPVVAAPVTAAPPAPKTVAPPPPTTVAPPPPVSLPTPAVAPIATPEPVQSTPAPAPAPVKAPPPPAPGAPPPPRGLPPPPVRKAPPPPPSNTAAAAPSGGLAAELARRMGS